MNVANRADLHFLVPVNAGGAGSYAQVTFSTAVKTAITEFALHDDTKAVSITSKTGNPDVRFRCDDTDASTSVGDIIFNGGTRWFSRAAYENMTLATAASSGPFEITQWTY